MKKEPERATANDDLVYYAAWGTLDNNISGDRVVIDCRRAHIINENLLRESDKLCAGRGEREELVLVV
jgi:hypothetical protein